VARLIESFVPHPDVEERHVTIVAAPADIVFDVASAFDLFSLPTVAAIFWLREKVLRSKAPPRRPEGLVSETLALGWGRLAEREKRELVMGAVTQPWQADVRFKALPPAEFAAFAEPDLVKIAWTLEAEPIDPTHTRFATETRVVATNEWARLKFKRYFRLFGIGIVLIRRLMLPAVRRKAERRFRDAARRAPEASTPPPPP